LLLAVAAVVVVMDQVEVVLVLLALPVQRVKVMRGEMVLIFQMLLIPAVVVVVRGQLEPMLQAPLQAMVAMVL
jgi:hypothetical protein